MDSIPANWPPTTQQPVGNELLLDNHRQLDASDLLDDATTVSHQRSFSLAEDSTDAFQEDVTLGSESTEWPVNLGLGGNPMPPATFGEPAPYILPSSLSDPAPMGRAPSLGFDEVPAAAPPNAMPIGGFSTPGSLIDIQPMEPSKPPPAHQNASLVDNGPIPFFQPSQTTSTPNIDFFASLPETQPVTSPQAPASDSIQQQSTHHMSPLTSSPSRVSPSTASIVSLETATMTGQRKPEAISPADKPLPPPPQSGFYTSPTASTRPTTSSHGIPKPSQSIGAIDPKYRTLPMVRWIDPTVFYEIPLRDPVGEVFPKAYPSTYTGPRPVRKILRVEDVLSDPDPFLTLVNAHSWRSVAMLAKQHVISTHPTEVKTIMRLWFVRLMALAKLKLYEFASSELNKVTGGDLDSPNLRYETYPDIFPNLTGPMVSFEIRLFSARIPSFKGDHPKSINKMYKLLYTCHRMISHCHSNGGIAEGDPLNLWQTRSTQLQLQIANLLLELKDHRPATAILCALSQSHPTDPHLLSSLGRLYLQIGNIPSARETFSRVSILIGPDPTTSTHPHLLLSNTAFLHISEGDFSSALQPLTHLLSLTNSPASVNNLALCQLYTGNVGQAVSFLDSIVIDMPGKAGVCEELLFNLCSLYELTDLTAERKRKLVGNVVARFAGDDFETACLKF